MFNLSAPEVKRDDGSIGSLMRSLLARSENGVVTIAPGTAQRIIDEAHFEGQRDVKDVRVNDLYQEITHDRWQPQLTAITFAETPDGKIYNINGQHRCHAVVRVGRKIDNLVTIIKVDDMNRVRRLYAMFDTREPIRTESEMLHGSGVPQAMGLKRKTTTALFKALTIIRNDMEPMASATISEARSRSGRLEEIGDWGPEAKRFEILVDTADRYLQHKLMATGAMAFCLYVLRHRPKEADVFIGGIAANDGLRKNDPRARLIADFQNRNLKAGSVRQAVQRMAVAWNAFVEGRDLSIIKCVDGAPILIKGTPRGKAGTR